MTELTPADTPDSPATISRTSVLAFFAADHVAATPDGKLYVNGGFFGLLRFPVFPAILPTLGIGVVLEIPFHEMMRNHIIRIGLRGPEGEELPLRIEANLRSIPGLETKFGEPGIVPFGMVVTNVQFPASGSYRLVLWYDDTERSTYRLNVVQTPMVASAGSMHQPNI